MAISVKCDHCGHVITVNEAITKASEVTDLENSKVEVTAKLTQDFTTKTTAADAAILLKKQQNQAVIDQITSLLTQLQ